MHSCRVFRIIGLEKQGVILYNKKCDDLYNRKILLRRNCKENEVV